MSSIQSLFTSRDSLREFRVRNAGAWSIELRADGVNPGHATASRVRVFSFTHYSTVMLTWAEITDSTYGDRVEVRQSSVGWSSVSDQNGMNIAFSALGLPYRFDRTASRIVELTRNADGYICWGDNLRELQADGSLVMPALGVGTRVQLAPHSDLWMAGDRFGEITRFSTDRGTATVKLDRSGRKRRIGTYLLTPVAA